MRIYIYYVTLVLVIHFSINFSCYGTYNFNQPLTKFSDLENEVILNENLLLFKDETRELGLNDILNKEFVPNNMSSISLGYNNDADWIKFNILYAGDSAIEAILKIDKILIDNIWLYYYNKQLQRWDSIQAGTVVPRDNKPILGYGTYFPINISPNVNCTYYLKCISSYGKDFSMSLITDSAQHVSDMNTLLYIGIFLGIFLCITLYNLFIGFSINDNLYYHYALSNLLSLLGGLGVMGVFAYYIPANNPNLIPYLTSFSIGFSIIFMANFNIRILELKNYSRFALYLMLFVAIFGSCVSIGLNVMRYIGKPTHYSLISLITFLFSLTALISGIIALRKGSKYARFYIIAWTAALVGLFLKSLTLMGYVPKTQLTSNFFAIGVSLETLLLSFALADRYNYIQKEKNKLELELQYKSSDLTKVVTDNRMRHAFKLNVVEQLKNISKKDNNKIKKELGSFLTNLNIELDAEENRNVLQEKIDLINTEFERKLKDRFPKLTRNEIEICGYLKLNLSIKEIANLRKTTESSVKVAKHRINKKMLKEGTTIKEVLNEV